MNKPKTITCTVNRATWARGSFNMPKEICDDGEVNHLLNDTGSMCCLGFLGKACGVSTEVLLNTAMPDRLPQEEYNKYPVSPIGRAGWVTFSALNDALDISETEREQQLRDLAKERGFEFRFTGK